MCLVASIPHADQIKRTWKHAGFEYPQEEPSGEQASVVCDEALHHGHETEAEHANGEPNAGLQFLENDVGRNLEEDVGDEEDHKSCVVLGSIDDPQLLAEAKNVRVGDVHTVQTVVEVSKSVKARDEESVVVKS